METGTYIIPKAPGLGTVVSPTPTLTPPTPIPTPPHSGGNQGNNGGDIINNQPNGNGIPDFDGSGALLPISGFGYSRAPQVTPDTTQLALENGIQREHLEEKTESILIIED